MDLGILMELAGKGEQVEIISTDGLITEDFYRVLFTSNTSFTELEINGVSQVNLIANGAITRHLVLHGVNKIHIANSGGHAIGYKKL
mgnify:CR=1 FL=1|tara:strand:- start:788 stop:1048 length:261 start_codon:yes stop_codon:yes gene_type:complete